YYYDRESNMYYCKSRYYVPEWCRWLNADNNYLDLENVSSMNLFSYCGDNPVMLLDENGNFGILVGLLLALTRALGSCAINGLVAMARKEDDESNLGAFLGGFFGNMTSQYISYGDFQPLPALVQGGYSAFVNGFFMCRFFSVWCICKFLFCISFT
ncbi:MAG: hypothetical protein NC310_09180, partial [Roseburia sp.]|nr:hypothetical protein [Roseburia sp.]